MARKKAADIQPGDKVYRYSIDVYHRVVTKVNKTSTSGGCRVSLFVKSDHGERLWATFRGSTMIQVVK